MNSKGEGCFIVYIKENWAMGGEGGFGLVNKL